MILSCLASCFMCVPLDAITLVYNLRTRRVFSLAESLEKQVESQWIATAVPIIFTRNRHIVNTNLGVDVCEKRLTGGVLLNVRYIPSKSWWFEVTTGIEREHADLKGTTTVNTSRAGVDDIVVSGGYNIKPSSNSHVVLYGLAGLPTRRKVSKIEELGTFVGTRFFNLGVGAELSYAFLNTLKRSFTGTFQNRFIHAFNRRWFPILPCDAKIQPGNVTDLLFVGQYRERRNIFSLSYNLTFFTNQALLLATGPVKTDTFLRHSVTGTYTHIFRGPSSLKKPIIFGGGLNIARSKKFDSKTFACWLNVSMIF